MLSRHRTVACAVALWAAFAVVHLWLSYAVLNGPHTPLNDVATVYRDWIFAGTHGLGWVGLERVWVYPTVALLPMLLSAVFGFANYATVWLVLVALLDASALAVLTRAGTRNVGIGAWWLGFLVALGPIAVGRIDSITVPLALAGVLAVARKPVVAGILLALATWIKVWPAALLLAVVVASKRRIEVAAAALGTSVVVILLALLVGGTWPVITGFVGQQTGRGLQIEAPVTTFWLWLEALGVPGVTTGFDQGLLTYQVAGPGVAVTARVMTPVLVVVFAGLAVLGAWAVRRVGGGVGFGRGRGVGLVGLRVAGSAEVLAPLALAMTTAFIVTNKVGSPQYEGWLAVPVVFGLVMARAGSRSFALPGSLAIAIAGLTQAVYPWGYDALVLAHPWMVALITVRNGLLVALLVVAVVRVVRVGLAGAEPRTESETSSDGGASVPPGSDGADVAGSTHDRRLQRVAQRGSTRRQ